MNRIAPLQIRCPKIGYADEFLSVTSLCNRVAVGTGSCVVLMSFLPAERWLAREFMLIDLVVPLISQILREFMLI